jgi:iron(II)-dependent oxidoreductase
LSTFSHEWKVLPQKIADVAPTTPARGDVDGMIKIPGGDFVFRMTGTEVEGSDDVGTDVQYPWEDSPRRFHEHLMQIKPFYIDKYPVTNAEFKKFIDATHYHPKDDGNFLKDWKDGTYPQGWDKKPVTWVSRETPQPTRNGQANGCRMNGNGNSQPRARMAGSTLGATW